MGGEGSILGMINSYRDNRRLRRKKSIFEKDGAFESGGEATFGNSGLELDLRSLTDEERRIYQERTLSIMKS